jgi:hypothetical protein
VDPSRFSNTSINGGILRGASLGGFTHPLSPQPLSIWTHHERAEDST